MAFTASKFACDVFVYFLKESCGGSGKNIEHNRLSHHELCSVPVTPLSNSSINVKQHQNQYNQLQISTLYNHITEIRLYNLYRIKQQQNLHSKKNTTIIDTSTAISLIL